MLQSSGQCQTLSHTLVQISVAFKRKVVLLRSGPFRIYRNLSYVSVKYQRLVSLWNSLWDIKIETNMILGEI